MPEFLDLVAMIPLEGDRVVNSLLTAKEIVDVPLNLYGELSTIYKGDLRLYACNANDQLVMSDYLRFVHSKVVTEFPVANILGKFTPQSPDVPEQYWQFDTFPDKIQDYLVFLLHVPITECRLNFRGNPIEPDTVLFSKDLPGWGWSVSLSEMRTAWIAEVLIGYLWTGKSQYLITRNLFGNKLQVHSDNSGPLFLKYSSIIENLTEQLNIVCRTSVALRQLQAAARDKQYILQSSWAYNNARNAKRVGEKMIATGILQKEPLRDVSRSANMTEAFSHFDVIEIV